MDVLTIPEDAYRQHLQKAILEGKRIIARRLKRIHFKAYRKGESPLSKENKSGWNACRTAFMDAVLEELNKI